MDTLLTVATVTLGTATAAGMLYQFVVLARISVAGPFRTFRQG